MATPETATSRFQEKALEKLQHSRKTFMRQGSIRNKLLSLEDEEEYRGTSVHESFEQGCARGDYQFVQQCLAGSNDGGKVLLARNPNALHVACRDGRARVTKILLKCLTKEAINRRDMSGTTPLMEVCRSVNNPITMRVACLKALVEYGADVMVQDKSGDTCLHHTVRRRDIVLTRSLFSLVPETLLLLDVVNAKGRRPIDLCADDLRFTEFLNGIEAKSVFVRKLLVHKHNNQEKREDQRNLANDYFSHCVELAHDICDNVDRWCSEQRNFAEMERRKEEEEAVRVAVKNASDQATKWLQGPYGSNELKNLTKAIKKDLKEKRKAEGSVSTDNFAKVAKEKATEMLIKRKQGEAKAKAIADFRSRNPPI